MSCYMLPAKSSRTTAWNKTLWCILLYVSAVAQSAVSPQLLTKALNPALRISSTWPAAASATATGTGSATMRPSKTPEPEPPTRGSPRVSGGLLRAFLWDSGARGCGCAPRSSRSRTIARPRSDQIPSSTGPWHRDPDYDVNGELTGQPKAKPTSALEPEVAPDEALALIPCRDWLRARSACLLPALLLSV